MKCTIPEISWHNKEPVLSVDIQQIDQADAKFYRLASGGSDNHVLIWQLKIQENGAAAIELLSDLTRHQRSVNVVRWSPNGQFLASADDDANIIIWTLKLDNNIPSLDGEDETNKESWIVYKVLRGHKEDIYDMCWSPDGAKLLTGSIDNTAIVWDVNKGKNEHIITEHKSFVQGVAWNPTHHPPYMATLSSDRTCRILDTTTLRYQIRYRIARSTLPLPQTHPSYCASAESVKLFHDDTFRTYFRRLSFTPDGTLLLVPSGYVEMGAEGEERKVLYGTYVFPTMGSFSTPSAILVSPRQCTIAVRCCPLLFELRPDGPDPYVQLPYRMIFAVATDSDVVLYDTQQIAPFAHLQNIHYTRLTDLTWSPDGRILTAASTDGFCTIVTFDANELGKVYVKEESEAEESALNVSAEVVESPMEVESEVPAVENKKRKPSFLEQWTKSGKNSPQTASVSKAKAALFINKREFDCEIIDLSKSNDTKRIAPRRITPTLISAPAEPRGITETQKTVSEFIDLTERGSQAKTSSPSSAKKFKTSTLLSFIQRGPKVVKNELRKLVDVEKSVLVEENARDAWKCEEQNHALTIDESVDIPEDFKLQLEETETRQTNDSGDEGVLFINDSAVDVKVAKENGDVNLGKTVVVKRRVALITLSSPKNKKPTESPAL